MAAINRTPEARAKSSETAKKTSARPDIQKQRAERLARWRQENPEKFIAIMEKGCRAVKRSKAEEWLEKNVLLELGFRRNVRVRCGQNRKQCDFVRKDFWVEVDGCWHFGVKFSRNTSSRYDVNKVHVRDVMLNKEAERRGLTLVRLGLDCWRGNGHRILRDEWLELLLRMISSPSPGVYLFGKCYEQGVWASDRCSTWKYVTHPTTSFSPAG